MKFTETRNKGNKLCSLESRNSGQSNEKFENHFRPKEIITDTWLRPFSRETQENDKTAISESILHRLYISFQKHTYTRRYRITHALNFTHIDLYRL